MDKNAFKKFHLFFMDFNTLYNTLYKTIILNFYTAYILEKNALKYALNFHSI